MTRITPEQLDLIFEEATDQSDALIRIYKTVLPRWDEIERLDHWPSCNSKTWQEVAKRFMAFDRLHHPEVMNGGCWMNNGFSVDRKLKDWQVSTATCTITYKEVNHAPAV